MMSSDPSIPSLSSCTPEEASKFLLECRFQGNATEVASFLLQAIDKLPNIEEINKALAEGGAEESEDEVSASPADSLGLPLEELPQPNRKTDEPCSAITISAISPRMKFTLNMYEEGCILTSSKQEQIIIASNQVEHVIMFPKREDCLKAPKKSKDSSTEVIIPGSTILLVLKEAVTFRKKELTQICFQLPQHNSDSVQISDDEELHDHNFVDSFEAQWENLFQSSFDVKDVIRVYNPKIHKVINSYHFQSDQGDANTSIMQGGMPYVKCYSGVNDGVLFPLEEGLLFFKPPKFIHRSNLHSISCGRGSGGSRYVDLVATLDNKSNETNDSIEFTNIDREELQCLNDYIHNVLVKAMAKDANDEDGEISDTAMMNGDSDTNTKSRKRKSQRAASVDARKATKVQIRSTVSNDQSEDDDDDFIKDDSEGEDESDHESQSEDDDSEAESDTESDEED